MEDNNNNNENESFERKSMMNFDVMEFKKLVLKDLKESRAGRRILKKFTQGDVRDMIENYQSEANQKQLVKISRLMYVKSPQYQRMIKHFSEMATFPQVISPRKAIKEKPVEEVKAQYIQIAELLKVMNLRHEMKKVLKTAFIEDVFYGYIHKDKNSFYIQKVDPSICKITHVEDGVYNYSLKMTYFQADETRLEGWADDVVQRYYAWKQIIKRDKEYGQWMELNPKETICIKTNEEMLEVVPPFVATFDSLFDIDGFKELRQDRERMNNYMLISQRVPIRVDTENNNDFAIDKDMMMFFHRMASNTVPENVGVITSPMQIEAVRFDRDKADTDSVSKAERDFWNASGTSQLLFNADKSTSEGLKASIKTDEQITFGLVTQIERWLNRYLRYNVRKLIFYVNILSVTYFNRDEMRKMYSESSQYGVPVKSHLSAVLGLDPLDVMEMAYLENDILEINENFIPLQSSHVGGGADAGEQGGRPTEDDVGDEGARQRDKPNE